MWNSNPPPPPRHGGNETTASSAVPSGFYDATSKLSASAATSTETLGSSGHQLQYPSQRITTAAAAAAAYTNPNTNSRYQPQNHNPPSRRYHHQNNTPNNNTRHGHLYKQSTSSTRTGYNPYGATPPVLLHAPPQVQSQTSTHPIEESSPSSSRKRSRDDTNSNHSNDQQQQQQRESYYCDPCELEFDSKTALASHEKSHVKCSICAFVGAPKVVKGHYQATHGKFSVNGFKTVTIQIPGCPVQRFRICVGNHPQDVQRWIQERKKKFPRLSTNTGTTTTAAAATVTTTISNQPQENQGVLSSLLQGYSSSEDEDEEREETAKQETVQSTLSTKQDEEESSSSPQPTDNQPSTTPMTAGSAAATTTTTTMTSFSANPCHSFVRYGRCRRGDACPYSHDPNLRRATTTTTGGGMNQRNNHKNPKKKTLLNALLEKDRDRETKFALQLIHYMVDTNFLQDRPDRKSE
jgi:hypothetical protein